MEEKIKKHKDELKKLEESFGKNPSDDLQAKINREKDAILQLSNVSSGNPKQRAEEKSKLAAEIVRGKAVKNSA